MYIIYLILFSVMAISAILSANYAEAYSNKNKKSKHSRKTLIFLHDFFDKLSYSTMVIIVFLTLLFDNVPELALYIVLTLTLIQILVTILTIVIAFRDRSVLEDKNESNKNYRIYRILNLANALLLVGVSLIGVPAIVMHVVYS